MILRLLHFAIDQIIVKFLILSAQESSTAQLLVERDQNKVLEVPPII